MSVMLKSGVPLSQALDLLAENTQTNNLEQTYLTYQKSLAVEKNYHHV